MKLDTYRQQMRELNPFLWETTQPHDLTVARAVITQRNDQQIVERLVQAGYNIDPDNIYTFSAEISNDGVDAYFSHMHKTTLGNFARGAETGVSLLDSHDSRQLGIGYSCGGRLIEEGGVVRVVADFYIVRGLKYGGGYSYSTSDDFIVAIESGVVRDVSVGLYGGRHICDIDGQSIWSWDCPHFPGQTYAVTDAESGEETLIVCTYTIYDGILAEVSIVYDGATPSAMIMKGIDGVVSERMTPAALAELVKATRTNIRLPQNGEAMNEQTPNGPDAITTDVVWDYLATYGVTSDTTTDMVTAVRQLVSNLEGERDAAAARAAALESNLEASEIWAAQGRQYHAHLIDQVVEAGVRAQGNAFPVDTYRELLASASISHLKRVLQSLDEAANLALGSGRRITEDAEKRASKRIPTGQPDDVQWQPDAPAAAYS